VIRDAALSAYRLALVRPWRSAQGVLSERRGWLVRLTTTQGIAGFGECAPLPASGTEDAVSASEGLQEALQRCLGADPLAMLSRLGLWRDRPAARCAVETALLDVLARQAALPLARWLNPKASGRVRVNAALGAIDAGLASRVSQAIAQGFKVLKLKAGVQDLDTELRRLCVLSRTLPPGVRLRLDANRAWGEEQALEAVRTLSRLPIESLEEPLRVPEAAPLRRLQGMAPWPIALDESLRPGSASAWLAAAPVRRLILKPMVQGGVLCAFELAQEAQRRGLECVVTTTLDGAAGVSAAAHLAAALGAGGTHGLGTAAWLRRDLGVSPVIQRAQMRLRRAPGLGFAPYPGIGFASVQDRGNGHAL
jgi:o-succinylbenzoate synthase